MFLMCLFFIKMSEIFGQLKKREEDRKKRAYKQMKKNGHFNLCLFRLVAQIREREKYRLKLNYKNYTLIF